jgi:hypothetical protein
MSEKSSIFQGVQIGKQSAEGTAVAANKKLLSVSMRPGPRVEMDKFRPEGMKYPTLVSLNKEWTEVDIKGKLAYNEINYLLSSLLAEPTPVQQESTEAYKWTYTSDSDGADGGNLYTIEQGDANNAWEAADMRVSGLTFTFNRNELSIAGTAIAAALETGITLTSSPTELTPVIALPSHLKFYMADTQAGLDGASAMTRGFSMEFGLNDKFGKAWPVGQDPVTVETEPTLEGKLRLATDSVGHGLLATMRAGDTKWFRALAEGATIDGAYKNTFQIDFPVKIADASDPEDNDGIHVMEYGLAIIHDATWGKAFQIDVITTLTAL